MTFVSDERDDTSPAADELSSSQRRAIQLFIVISVVIGTLGTAFLPYLLVHHPILLLLSSADGRNVVLLTPTLDASILVPIAVVRRVLAMLSTYGLGLLYGRALLEAAGRKTPRLHQLLVRFERVFVAYRAPTLVLWPSYTCCTVAGVTRTPLRTFLPWMALGQVAFVLFWYVLGNAASRWTDLLVAWLRGHIVETTVVCLLVIGAQQLASHVRQRRGAKAASERHAVEHPSNDPPTE